MASADAIAVEHHAEQVSLSNLAAYRTQALWMMVDQANISDSWAALLPRAVQTVSAAQFLAASRANTYTRSVLEAQDIDPEGPSILPSSLAGVASDGRSLAGLLASPVYTALDAIKGGASIDRAMAAGLNDAIMLASSSVTDAGRVADGIGIASRRTVTGYIRMTSGKCCSRCAVLAGRFYRWNSGFLRHPGCACIHIPAGENVSGDKRTDPYKYFDSLSRAEQDKRFTKDGAQAIRDGADMNQVVNARRGMSTTAGGSKVTSEGTGKRGYFRSVGGGSNLRMMPEEIYKRANTRDQAIQMLTQHGYITSAGQVPAAIRGEGYGFASGFKLN
jgi:hypothetical protein